ncbi:hypothetical protein OG349_07655 [Streptomyces sp. NBC_01317]|uniref:hypothetical protein n=1 Tax=Streptomyces sp. NBC_01317 TaxID=2903822 RepID=UPI002E158784|nr:hypothetical protein OG349_07655 [Streptomyces sp. NBC_01317]
MLGLCHEGVASGKRPDTHCRIRLHWEPASPAGWDVTAHLGLATTEVHLATWSAVPNDWPRLIRPTLHEVLGLCAALDLSNRLAQV